MSGRDIAENILGNLAGYLLAVIAAPVLGFTAILDIAYIATGHPIKALLWMFVFGPTILVGVCFLSEL